VGRSVIFGKNDAKPVLQRELFEDDALRDAGLDPDQQEEGRQDYF
jgi:hypothetical protein